MVNKTILKQTIKANLKIWLVITLVLSAFSALLIGVFDPKTISNVTGMVKDTPLAKLLANTTFLGMLSQTFYAIHGIILPLIFIIITAGNLIVSKVDKGSLAYLLSTPTKRNAIVRTQAFYFVTSLFSMLSIVTMTGLLAIQVFHGGVWSKGYTEDVKAASTVLNLKNSEVADDLAQISKDPDALKAGAEARGIDEESYTAYLNLKITENAYQAAAVIMDVDAADLSNDPSTIKDNPDALAAAAKVMGMDSTAYSEYLDQTMAQKKIIAEKSKEIQDQYVKGLTAAAEVLGMQESELITDMGKLKSNVEAFNAAVQASGIPPVLFTEVVNQQIATNEVAADKGIDLNIQNYLLLNLGLFLLMFATSGISFMFSCIFNLTKNYMAFGAGIPLMFFLFQMMGNVSDSLKGMKYLTLNSLFDTHAILNGGDYFLQFIALGAVGILLYGIGMKVFVKKDLPL